MIFSGSLGGSFAFEIQGAPTVGSETKAVEFSRSLSIADGEDAGEATAGWADLVEIPAGSVLSVDMLHADLTALGFAGFVEFDEIRALWVRNQESSDTAVVLVGCPSAGNDTTAYAARLTGGARWCWDNLTHGTAVTNANRYFTITNTSAAAVAVEIGVIGLGTFVDAEA